MKIATDKRILRAAFESALQADDAVEHYGDAPYRDDLKMEEALARRRVAVEIIMLYFMGFHDDAEESLKKWADAKGR